MMFILGYILPIIILAICIIWWTIRLKFTKMCSLEHKDTIVVRQFTLYAMFIPVINIVAVIILIISTISHYFEKDK
jgi:hypothetical protein